MSPAELQLLVGMAGVVLFVGLFLAILFLAVVGFGIARLLYIGGRWCTERIRRLHTMNGTSTMHAVVRMVPHHH